ncbi:MAG TPA: type II toxin-antitoxin system VapB family antitoxin [Thermoanaerobaculia bacterium]
MAKARPRKTLGPPPRNRAVDAELLDQALSVGGFRTKRETVNQALREFIARRHRLGLVDLFGKVDYDPSYDYKKERRAR